MNDIYVLDKNLNQIGIVDTYKSCIWANRYDKPGDCELYVEATTEKMKLLVKGNYLMRLDDDMICQIKKIELDTDSENGNYLIVTGYDVKRFLDQRVVWGTYFVDGNVEDYLRNIINRTLGNPTLSARQLKKANGERLFYLGDKANFSDVTTEQNSYNNVGDLVREKCQKYNWGYKVVLSDKVLYFKLYKGTDRSNLVIFSNYYENLEATKYVEDDTQLGNVALVAGEGEGSERSRNVSGYAEGVDRYEIYVDAKDISRTITWEELTSMYPTTDQGGHGYIYITSPQQAITYKMDIIDIQIVDNNQLTELKIAYPNGKVITKQGNTYYQIYDVIIADLESDSPASGDSVILRDVVYSVYLLNRGYEKLAEYGGTKSFEGTVEPNTTFKYKQDYFLGDEVTVENEYGISTTARIIEVVEVHDDNGYSVEPKFEYLDTGIEPVPTNNEGLILTESLEAITTETGSRLLNEAVEEITILTASNTPVVTNEDIPNVKISELEEVTNVNDGCCVPIVSNGETRKMSYGYLKNKLAGDLPQNAFRNLYSTYLYQMNTDYRSTANFIEVEPNTTYILSSKDNNVNFWGNLIFYNEQKEQMSQVFTFIQPFTTPEDCKYIKLIFANANAPIDAKIQLEEGTVATSYTPFIDYVEETGSNDYGSYIKYRNGTMICTKKVTGSADITNAWGSLYEGDVDLGSSPQTFMEKPVINYSIVGEYVFVGGTLTKPTVSNFGTITLMRPTSQSATPYEIDVTAFGKWK